MRDLLERVAYLSAGGAKKVYILDEVHMLTPSAAAALLKTLEEPPEHVVFVLATTDPQKVAPTIRSPHAALRVHALHRRRDRRAPRRHRRARRASRPTPRRSTVIARAGAARCATRCRCSTRRSRTVRIDVEQVQALFGGARSTVGSRCSERWPTKTSPARSSALGELLDAGHEPRRVADDLLATVRDAFLLTSATWAGARRRCPPTTSERARRARRAAGRAALVRTLEMLGQAVVDIRGTDAADPRLVLEVALVRLARREAGTPLQTLADRVERLERERAADRARHRRRGCVHRRPTPRRSTRPRRGWPVARWAASPSRRDRPAPPRPSRRPPAPPAAAAADAWPTPCMPAPRSPRPRRRRREVDLDDVIVAWAEILAELPPVTRAAVQEAQPIAVDDGVIMFGVPKAHVRRDERASARRPTRSATRSPQQLGRARCMFKPVDGTTGFDADPRRHRRPRARSTSRRPTTRCSTSTELVDDAHEVPAVDSVSLITQSLGATVVEEVPRD